MKSFEMWKSTLRNQYLHKISEGSVMNPVLLNHCIETAMDPKFSFVNHGPVNINPEYFGAHPNMQKARVAYGLWGIPKLIAEMTSQNKEVQKRAIDSLAEELVDNCKCYRAIEEFNIVKRFNKAITMFISWSKTDSKSLECLLECIGLISTHCDGAKKIIAEYELVKSIYGMIVDKSCVSRNAANALYRMSSHPTVADLMAGENHIKHVLHVLDRVDDLDDIYLLLANLIERSPKRALENGVMKALLPQVVKRENLLSSSMKCFALSLNCKEADEYVCLMALVTILYEMLADDDLPLDLHEYSALALMNVIFNTNVMWKCREIWDLPFVLIKRAHSKSSNEMQLWCLQALRQLIMMPSIRNFVRKTAKKRVKTIVCKKIYVERVKNELLEQLRKKPFPTASSKADEDFSNGCGAIADKMKANQERLITGQNCVSSATNFRVLAWDVLPIDDPYPIKMNIDRK